MQGTKLLGINFFGLYQLKQVLEIKVHDRATFFSSAVNIHQAFRNQKKCFVSQSGHWNISLPPFQMIEHIVFDNIEIKATRNKIA